MLGHLGYGTEARRIERAIDAVCEDGRVLTGDVGGHASTQEVGDALAQALASEG
jgi:isocitrate/isopropylmalate dehydrogenase